MEREELLAEDRPFDEEYEQHLKEVEVVRSKAESYWDTFHKYDKYPTQGKEDYINGFVAGWFQRAGIR